MLKLKKECKTSIYWIDYESIKLNNQKFGALSNDKAESSLQPSFSVRRSNCLEILSLGPISCIADSLAFKYFFQKK